jgi:hypothetical protein
MGGAPPAGPQGGPPQATAVPQPSGDGFAGITGDLVDGRFSENEAKPIANQNSKLLRVRLGEPFMARQGSMVVYQGNVDFSFEGGGASRFIKKAADRRGSAVDALPRSGPAIGGHPAGRDAITLRARAAPSPGRR